MRAAEQGDGQSTRRHQADRERDRAGAAQCDDLAGVLTLLSSLSFWTLRREDGESVSRGARVEIRPGVDVEPRTALAGSLDTQ